MTANGYSGRPDNNVERVPAIGGAAGWLTFAALSAVVELVIGGVIVAVLHMIPGRKHH
ncbi:MAG TPA: hypothetical protein VGE08_05935 [Steroidobacter sp.]|uniref:hypothetical protein n=1 Tax=Steroidobacter sp. TaxID=1978227 RepID=UPI002ED88D90